MRAAIDMTLARGPVVAARSGIAVEANHQSFPRSSSSGLIRNFHNCLTCIGAGSARLSTMSSVEFGIAEDSAPAVLALLGGDSELPIAGSHGLVIAQAIVIPSLSLGRWSKTKCEDKGLSDRGLEVDLKGPEGP